MKLKVLRHYFDGKDRRAGQIIEEDDEKAKALLADKRGLVEIVKQKKKEAK